MSAQSTLNPPGGRRTKPSMVQTNLPTIPSAIVPASAASCSSVASSSQQASPIMSPQSTLMTTTNSSIQGSPEGPRGRDAEILPTPFELPEAIVSRKSSQSAMSEALASTKTPGLMRRVSNRLTRRRQSSTHTNSRDQSAGPVIMRRRSDSTSTAPEHSRSILSTDSDEEIYHEDAREDLGLFLGLTGADSSQDSGYASAGNSSTFDDNGGPVIPMSLLQGTRLMKVSKKKREWKTFTLDIEPAKVTWDRTRPYKCFWIDDVTEIRTGPDARNYREEFGFTEAEEPRFFSVIYNRSDKSNGRSQKTMHLIAPDAKTFEQWTTTLDAISKHRHEFMWQLSAFSDKAVKAYWRREMNRQLGDRPRAEGEETVDLLGVESICRNLHIHGAVDHIRSSFHAADVSRAGRLNFSQFQDFCRRMKVREDIRPLYRTLGVDTSKGITLEEFLSFLIHSQNEDVVKYKSHWEGIFNKFARKSRGCLPAIQEAEEQPTQPLMNFTAFTSFMVSKYNVPLQEMSEDVTFMERPINEYFISSSHNTYLLGRQVAGESSVEAYISVLKTGCRCVEIDCWDGNDGWPIVVHGRTLTTHVSFKDVMTVVAKYAFVKVKTPLWLSLEVHCNAAQQAKMSQIIRDTCGMALVTEPLHPGTTEFPKLSELMGRILVKVKTPQSHELEKDMDRIGGRSRGISISSPFIRPVAADNSIIPPSSLPTSPPMSPYVRATRALSRSQTRAEPMMGDADSISSNSENESVNDDERTKKQSKIIKYLGDLGVYAGGMKFRGFDDPETKKFNHIFSFAEGTFHDHSKELQEKRALVRHNMKCLMRVYPAPWRVSSTNFDPLTFWRRGVQMVALNYQTYDLGMQINDAMFAGGSDQSGYVLKPRPMREITVLSEVPEAAGAGHIKRERKNVHFDIDVLSAQQLMRPLRLADNKTLDPYVEVEVYHADDKSKDSNSAGVVGDGGTDASRRGEKSGLGNPHRRRTGVVKNNGYNPEFNKQFHFELTTKYPDLVFVRFTVRNSRDGQNADEKGAPLAVYTAKLSSMKQGYRTLPLMDGNGNRFLFSTLFVRVKVNTATSIYVDSTEDAERVSKLKSIGRAVFPRSQTSPKTSVDKMSALPPPSTLVDISHL